MSVYLAAQPDPEAVMDALEREVVFAILLLELRFASGTVYLSDATIDFVDPEWSHTWKGCGAWVSAADVTGGPDNLAPMREYGLGVPWEVLTEEERESAELGIIPALVTDKAEYVNQPALLWEQLFHTEDVDAHGRPLPVGIPSALHFGIMDRARVSFGPSEAKLTLTVEGPLARKGAPVWGRLTPRDQKRRFPTPTPDKGLDHVPEVMSTQVKWTAW